MSRLPVLAIGLALAACAPPAVDVTAPVSPRQLHEELLVLDSHLDTPAVMARPGWRFDERHRYDEDFSQVDLPRMAEGGLDGGFFVIYTPQGPLTPAGYAEARKHALDRAQVLRATIERHKDAIALATAADDAERLHRAGKRIAYVAIENSYPLGEDLNALGEFYRLGVRMAGPVHSATNQLADSTTGEARWNGLSPLGRQWVAAMNRLGMVIDGSHASDAAFDQLLALSMAPIVLSHSGPKALYDHPRNLDDGRMRALANKGGVMLINSLFLVAHDDSPERKAIIARQERWQQLSAAERTQLLSDKAALDARRPYTTADFDMYMGSMLHAIRIMGIDHVGLGADWDGNGGLKGMADVTALPKITERLRAEGFSDADIAKVMGGNLLRVLRANEQLAARQDS